MVQKLLGGIDGKSSGGYEWALEDGRKVVLRVTIEDGKENNQ